MGTLNGNPDWEHGNPEWEHGNPEYIWTRVSGIAAGVGPAGKHSSPQNGSPTVIRVTFACLRTIWTRLQNVFGILTDGTRRYGIPRHLGAAHGGSEILGKRWYSGLRGPQSVATPARGSRDFSGESPRWRK